MKGKVKEEDLADYNISHEGLEHIRAIRRGYLEKAASGEELTAHEMYIIGLLDDAPTYSDLPMDDRMVREAILHVMEQQYIRNDDGLPSLREVRECSNVM